MGFRSWSKAIRELDWNVNWSIAVGKNTDTGTSAVNVYIRHEPTGRSPAETKVLDNQTIIKHSTEEFEVYPDFSHVAVPGFEFKLNGESFRGMNSISIPDGTDTTQKYKLVIENAGTSTITVFDGFASIRKLYPGETITEDAVDESGLTGADAAALHSRYVELNQDPRFEAFLFGAAAFLSSDPFPADLKAKFSGLSASSTTAELRAVLDSSAYQTYYATQFPKRPFPMTLAPEFNGSLTSYPLEINPGERVTVEFTGVIISYYTQKLAFD